MGLCRYIPGSACNTGREREILSVRKAIALGAIQNPLDVIYITAKDSLLIIHNPIQPVKLPIKLIYVLSDN